MGFKAISSAPREEDQRILLVSEFSEEPFIGFWNGENFIKESNEKLAYAYAWAKLPKKPAESLFPKRVEE